MYHFLTLEMLLGLSVLYQVINISLNCYNELTVSFERNISKDHNYKSHWPGDQM